MAHTHNKRSWAAFFQETTAGTPPANAAAWVTDGKAILHVAGGAGEIESLYIDDPTMETRAADVGLRAKIPGHRNVLNVPLSVSLTGYGSETATGNAIVETPYLTLWEHLMGGMNLGTTQLVDATPGSATEPALADATGINVGSLVAFEDTTSPSAANDQKLHFRRVIAKSGSTLTLSEALPFTPAENDICHAVATFFIDEDVLEDAVNGPSTFSWLFMNHSSRTDFITQLEGCVADFGLSNLSKGELPQVDLKIHAANYLHGGADSLSNPAFVTFHGNAPLSMGIDILVSIQDYGTTTVSNRDVNAIAFDPGFTRTPVDTTTEKTHRFEGLATWCVNFGKTTLTLTLAPYEDDWYADLEAGQFFRINIQQPGDGTGGGKSWCLHMAKAQLVKTPKRVEIGDAFGVELTFEPMKATDSSGTTDMDYSRFLIGIA